MIIGSTAVLRSIVTVPLAIHQNKLIAEIELRQPTISMMTEALKHRVVGECRKSGVSADEADKLFKKRVCAAVLHTYFSHTLYLDFLVQFF